MVAKVAARASARVEHRNNVILWHWSVRARLRWRPGKAARAQLLANLLQEVDGGGVLAKSNASPQPNHIQGSSPNSPTRHQREQPSASSRKSYGKSIN